MLLLAHIRTKHAQRCYAVLWERPLTIALGNYVVHTSQTLQTARPLLAAANVHLEYFARYCPEQSRIEPGWNDIKQHYLPTRIFAHVAHLKDAVDRALACKADQLQRRSEKSMNLHRLPT